MKECLECLSLTSKVLISNSWQLLQLFSDTNSGQNASMKCLFSSSCSLASCAIIFAATSKSTFNSVLPCQISQSNTPTTMEIHTFLTPISGKAHFRMKHSGSPIRKQLMRKCMKAQWCLPRAREIAERKTCRQSSVVYITRKGVRLYRWDITVESVVNIERHGRRKIPRRKKRTRISRIIAPFFMYQILLRLYWTKYLATFRQVTTDTPVKMKQPILCILVPIIWVEISSLHIDTVWNVKVSQARISKLRTTPLGSRVLASSKTCSLLMVWKCSILSSAFKLVSHIKKLRLKISVRILAITAPQLVKSQNLNRTMQIRMWNTEETMVEISWLLKLCLAFIRLRETRNPLLKKMLMIVYRTMGPAKALASSSRSSGKMKDFEIIRNRKMGMIMIMHRIRVRWQIMIMISFLRVDSRDYMPADSPSYRQYPKHMVQTRTSPQEDWAATELQAPRKQRLMMLGICSRSSSAETIAASDRSSLEEGAAFELPSSWLMKEMVDSPSHESFSKFQRSLSIFQAVDHILGEGHLQIELQTSEDSSSYSVNSSVPVKIRILELRTTRKNVDLRSKRVVEPLKRPFIRPNDLLQYLQLENTNIFILINPMFIPQKFHRFDLLFDPQRPLSSRFEAVFLLFELNLCCSVFKNPQSSSTLI